MGPWLKSSYRFGEGYFT